ncbi:MAG: OmpH family outer membrane protein [Chitinophagaceae bacterium]
MKKSIAVLMVCVATIVAQHVNAQSKLGHINTIELISAMPETKKAQEQIQKTQDSMRLVYAELVQEFNQRDSLFASDSAQWTPTKRNMKREELGQLYVKLQNFQNETQEFMEAKQQETYAPVQKLAIDAIQAVAKANGYAYVFSRDALLVVPASDDLLPLVKKYLKITDTAPAAPRPAPKQ